MNQPSSTGDSALTTTRHKERNPELWISFFFGILVGHVPPLRGCVLAKDVRPARRGRTSPATAGQRYFAFTNKPTARSVMDTMLPPNNEEERRVRRTVQKPAHSPEIPGCAARRTPRAIPSAPRRVRCPSTYVAADPLRQIALDQVRLLHLLDLREGGKIAVAQIEAIAPKWDRTRHHKLGHRPRTSRKSLKRALSRVTRWLRFLGWLDEPEEDRHPYSVELGTFEEWMRAERCLAEETIGNSLRSAREFLDWLTARGKHLESVRVADVDAAIEAKQTGRQYSRVTIRGYAKRLRAFVRFAENRGWCTSGMAEGIVPPRFYPDENVRSTLSRDDVRRLLATTDGDRPGDTHDRAILMLLIVYGLRAGEVRSLRLDDLDWENETLRVRRPKTGRTDLFPLSQAVGQAIVRYLVEVRRPGRACHLVFAGVDINTVRAWLGHSSIDTTNIYAEINLKMKAAAMALCDVAEPDPGRHWKEDKDLMAFLNSY